MVIFFVTPLPGEPLAKLSVYHKVSLWLAFSATGAPRHKTLMVNPSQQKCIVVVDDEPAVLQLLSDVVRQAGYMPHPACSAEEAMAVLGQVASETCLVISDVVMDGMNGHELASWICTEHPDLPVLLVSGYMDEQDCKPLPPGVKFRRKPLRIHEIQELMEQSCEVE